jgi:hypothetical protein
MARAAPGWSAAGAAARVETVLVRVEHLLPGRPLLAAREVRAHVRELLDDAEPAQHPQHRDDQHVGDRERLVDDVGVPCCP